MSNTYLLDRCIRVTLQSNTGGGGEYIEYAPLYSVDSAARIDGSVTDIYPPNKSRRPGYTAEIKLYNISNEVKAILANNGVWLSNLITDNMTDSEKSNIVSKYYDDRLRAVVEVGYYNREKKVPDYKKIFEGFINNTYSYRSGTDNITVVECFNFDEQQLNYTERLTKNTYSQEVAVNSSFSIGDPNWSNTFVGVVEKFGTEKANLKYGVSAADMISPVISNIKAVNDFRAKLSVASGYKTVKAGSLTLGKDFMIAFKTKPDIDSPDDYALKQALTGGMGSDVNNTSNFQSNFKTEKEILDQLCKETNPKVAWTKTIKAYNNILYVIYIIYRAGPGKIGSYSNADWKVVNYQNVLETPMITTSGALTVKLFLDGRIKPGDSIGFKTDSDLGRSNSDVVANTSFGNWGQSLAVSGQSSGVIPTVQGGNVLNISSQEKIYEDSQTTGYIFNHSFPIQKCIYEFSSHANPWHITVQTIPMIQGIFK